MAELDLHFGQCNRQRAAATGLAPTPERRVGGGARGARRRRLSLRYKRWARASRDTQGHSPFAPGPHHSSSRPSTKHGSLKRWGMATTIPTGPIWDQLVDHIAEYQDVPSYHVTGWYDSWGTQVANLNYIAAFEGQEEPAAVDRRPLDAWRPEPELRGHRRIRPGGCCRYERASTSLVRSMVAGASKWRGP